MADPVKHVTSITADSDGIYLGCTCGEELATWRDPIVAPTGEIHAKVIQHELLIMGRALSAALAPMLNPQVQQRLLGDIPSPPPLRLAPIRPENEE